MTINMYTSLQYWSGVSSCSSDASCHRVGWIYALDRMHYLDTRRLDFHYSYRYSNTACFCWCFVCHPTGYCQWAWMQSFCCSSIPLIPIQTIVILNRRNISFMLIKSPYTVGILDFIKRNQVDDAVFHILWNVFS